MTVRDRPARFASPTPVAPRPLLLAGLLLRTKRCGIHG